MLIATAERFSNRVENYAKYRPDYPAEVLGLFRDEMGLRKDSTVADIGSGTGISSRLFLRNGNRVFGIEPNEAMRLAAEEFLKDFPNFTSVDGTAEHTRLASLSIDVIIAAQAFHWFDSSRAAVEFRRILRPRGFIALIWNERKLDADPFLRDYEAFLLEFGVDYENVRHERITKEVLENGFQTGFHQAVFPNSQTLDYRGLEGRMLSASYMPAPEHPRFGTMIENFKTLFAEHQKNDRIQVSYDTNVFYTRF